MRQTNNIEVMDGQLMLSGLSSINSDVHEVYRIILRERVDTYGSQALSDEEILSLLVGVPTSSARNHIERYGIGELIKYADVLKLTKAQRKKLELLYSFIRRVNTCTIKERPVLNSSTKAGEFFVKEMQFYPNEVFKIALLDAQNRLKGVETMSEGVVNEAPVYPRAIVKTALDYNASSLILCHNHPAGSTSPSSADLDVTKRLVSALKTVSVTVVDHIIVASMQYVSLAERGLLSQI
jgi:DNA repair protein RadC